MIVFLFKLPKASALNMGFYEPAKIYALTFFLFFNSLIFPIWDFSETTVLPIGKDCMRIHLFDIDDEIANY